MKISEAKINTTRRDLRENPHLHRGWWKNTRIPVYYFVNRYNQVLAFNMDESDIFFIKDPSETYDKDIVTKVSNNELELLIRN